MPENWNPEFDIWLLIVWKPFIRCMAMGFSLGPMAESMRVLMKMIKNMDLGLFSIKMAEFMKVNGWMESNMVEEDTKRKILLKRVFGIMVSEPSGSEEKKMMTQHNWVKDKMIRTNKKRNRTARKKAKSPNHEILLI